MHIPAGRLAGGDLFFCLLFAYLKSSLWLLFIPNGSYPKHEKTRMNTGLSVLIRALILAEKERFELSRRFRDLLP